MPAETGKRGTEGMARTARHKSSEAAFYHVTNRVAGWTDWFPFDHRQARRKLLNLMLFYVNAYRCRLAAFQIMGNHFHFIVHFEKPRPLSRQEMMESARKLYGRKAELKTAHWTDAQWEAFNERLFDVSKLMLNLDGRYAAWYNRRFGRRGHFWGDRFKNPELLGYEAVQDAILYVELNAVRAGLVKRPEQWKWGSARWRLTGKDQSLIPLEELFQSDPETDVYSSYRARLYYRGAVPTRDNQAAIPRWIVRQEQRRGFTRAGAFRRRLRFLTDGLAVGPAERVAQLLMTYRQEGRYRRRRHPIPQLGGVLYSLREQRSNAFVS
jgi:REP element-mobilizing transposase RayT